MNQIYFMGQIEAIHELKKSKNNLSIMDILVKETKKFKGEITEEYRPITLFGSLADKLDNIDYVGKDVFVIASVSTKAWTDKDGNTKYPIRIIGSDVKLFDSSDATNVKKVYKEEIDMATSQPADLFAKEDQQVEDYGDLPF
jgi:single-stranded DNA-binding protein